MSGQRTDLLQSTTLADGYLVQRDGSLLFQTAYHAALQVAASEALSGLFAGLSYQGTWDPGSGAFPTSTTAGEFWEASGPGTIDGVTFAARDQIVAMVDGASTTTYAGNWVYRQATATLAEVAVAQTAAEAAQAAAETAQGMSEDARDAAAGSATAASEDADEASAAALSASSSATSAASSASSAATNAATTAADRSAVETLAAGANADYVVASYAALPGSPAAGEVALIIRDETAGDVPTFRVYNGSAWGAAVKLTRSYASVTAMAATAGQSGEVRVVTDALKGGHFEWLAGNQSSKVAADPQGGVRIPPASDLTGASGCWERIHFGVIHAEWFGATAGADDTTACQACWEYLVSQQDAWAWELRGWYKTRGFGDKNYKETYATKADADAGLAVLSDYDVIRVAADETQLDNEGDPTVGTLYRVIAGAYVSISKNGLNGKAIHGLRGASKKHTGFQLLGGMPSWMHLIAASTSQGGVVGVYFDGNNPSTQWGGAQNNPLTATLVYFEGYGLTWGDNTVRFSGGDGANFKGIVGNFEISGGDCCFNYNVGRGLTVGRMSGLNTTRLWVEGNDGGDILLSAPILSTDADLTTSQSYQNNSCVVIENIYSENNLDVPLLEVQGGHFAPRIGHIAQWGSGPGVGRTTVYLKNNSATADSVYQGCMGGVFDLGGVDGAKIICESESRNNTFIRSSQKWAQNDVSPWSFRDSGRDNQVRWRTLDAAAFTPGKVVGENASIIGKSTNFVDERAGATGTATNMVGGIFHPVLDYHPDFTTGPGFVRLSNFDTSDGGTEARIYCRLDAALGASAETFWLWLAIRAEAHQFVRLTLWDTINNEYYNWDSETWTALGSVDDWGRFRLITADPRSLYYQFKVVQDGSVARNLRAQLWLDGAGTCDPFHAGISTTKDSAVFAVVNGAFKGTPDAPKSTVANLPPAAAMPADTSCLVTDATSPALGAAPTGGGSTKVRVVADGAAAWTIG
ncbi:hypothetical protein [Tropicibacter alexandrii]|uniref:hypothetical protein n=1 Tax=Tropicibacter alexandrii TaxID=2267683 RepID=UPI001008E389|nr:hypothetical protein [Tropicibacter alexandrii]